jgi:hypothetical protein
MAIKRRGLGDIMNGIFAASDKTLHDVWHECVRRGADCTAARIQREMAQRAVSDQEPMPPPRVFNMLNQSAHINPFAY